MENGTDVFHQFLALIVDRELREIVVRCMVKSSEQFPAMLGKLVRELRAFDPAANPGGYIDSIRVWYDLNIWQTSLYVWDYVVDDIYQIWGAVISGFSDNDFLIKKVMKSLECTKLAGKRDMCCEAIGLISELLGKREFFLSVRTLAQCTSISPAQAARILQDLADEKVIHFVDKGVPSNTSRRASVINCGELCRKRTESPTRYVDLPSSKLVPKHRVPPKSAKKPNPQSDLDHPLRPWWLADHEEWDGANMYGPIPEDLK